MKDLRDAHIKEVQELNAKHNKEVQELNALNDKDTEKLRSEYQETIDSLRIDFEESEAARRKLHADIEILNSKLITFEEELYESKNIQLDLLDQLKLCEDKLEVAETKIVELLEHIDNIMKGLPTYIAHKEDKVDKVLGKYINSRPEHAKLDIMFLRESEGVY